MPFENIVGKGENASIFSFSHNVFYPIKDKFPFLSHTYFVVCSCFHLVKSEILSFGKELNWLYPQYGIFDKFYSLEMLHPNSLDRYELRSFS